MFFDFRVIIFILDVSKKVCAGKQALWHVKQSIIPFIHNAEADDLFYLYEPDNELAMYNTLHQAAAAVANFNGNAFNMPLAIEESLSLLDLFESQPLRYLVFI